MVKLAINSMNVGEIGRSVSSVIENVLNTAMIKQYGHGLVD
jgi:hypothetical protein